MMLPNQAIAIQPPSLSVYHKRQTCRVCGGVRLHPFLSLGPHPLANAFLKSPDEFAGEPFYPLDLCFCESCTLVQLLDVIDPEVLFRDYIYVTGTSETIALHNRQYAREMAGLLQLGPSDLVIELASNDGSLLKCFQTYQVRTLGIEPAGNIAQCALEDGVETLTEFFNSSNAAKIRRLYAPAKLVIANNVLAHVDETQDFLTGCKELLGDDGLIVIEVPYLGNLIDRLEYDTIYHEHLCYFSVTALLRLCDEVGLSVIRMDHQPVHGGSIRMYAELRELHRSHAQDVLAWAEAEHRAGLTDLACYEAFGGRVRDHRQVIRALLENFHSEGRSLAGYGAPAKGNTLLNYCGIGSNLISYVVDKNQWKVGLYTPGMHIPVLPVSTLLERQPDYVLILAWNFADEIMRQQEEYRRRGGQFIVPTPEPRVV
jgi:hypothetical protein